jgi:hypothetical protein
VAQHIGEGSLKHEQIVVAQDIASAAFMRSLLVCLALGAMFWISVVLALI